MKCEICHKKYNDRDEPEIICKRCISKGYEINNNMIDKKPKKKVVGKKKTAIKKVVKRKAPTKKLLKANECGNNECSCDCKCPWMRLVNWVKRVLRRG